MPRTRQLTTKADELYQSRVSSSSVNILADNFGDAPVNLVSTRAKFSLHSGPAKKSPPRRSQVRTRSPSRSPAPSSSSSTSSGFCWYHNKHGVNASNCREPCTFSGNDSSVHPAGSSVVSSHSYLHLLTPFPRITNPLRTKYSGTA